MALQNINLNPRMTKFLVKQEKVFVDQPLYILDVGVRGGLESQWKVYEDQAFHIGFEPDEIECQKLNQQFSGKNQEFYSLALGKQQEQQIFSVCTAPSGSSFYPANIDFLKRFPDDHLEQLKVTKTIEIETVALDSFIINNELKYIDFIKLDAEGSELDILKGGVEVLKKSVLGLSLEVLFHADIRNQPTFSEIDIFLNSLGFKLFDLATYRYARKTLPYPSNTFGATQKGQIMWAQALYLRDGVNEIESEPENHNWNKTKILKLASIMELFWLQDCAIELIKIAEKNKILTDENEGLIDLLTPPLQKNNTIKIVSYKDYLANFS
jgi:FkbM family methyltransferase